MKLSEIKLRIASIKAVLDDSVNKCTDINGNI